MQRLAADFLSNYVFLAVGRVGSSSALICQRVDYISDVEKGSHLRDLLYEQRARTVDNKVILRRTFVMSSLIHFSFVYCLLVQNISQFSCYLNNV